MSDTEQERAAYVAGLRRLADELEADPQMGLPYFGTRVNQVKVFVDRPATDPEASARAWRKVLGDPAPDVDPTSGHYKVRFRGAIDGLTVEVLVADAVALAEPRPEPVPALADWLRS